MLPKGHTEFIDTNDMLCSGRHKLYLIMRRPVSLDYIVKKCFGVLITKMLVICNKVVVSWTRHPFAVSV